MLGRSGGGGYMSCHTRFVQYSKGQVSTSATNSEFGSTRDLETVNRGVSREVFETFPALPGVLTIDF